MNDKKTFFPDFVLRGCQPTSRYQYERMVARFHEFLGDKSLIEATVEDFDMWASSNNWAEVTPTNPNPGNQTERLALNAIRAWLREVPKLPEHELVQHSIPDLEGPRRKCLPEDEKELAIEEMKRMTRPKSLIPRNIAFMELLWDTLARRSELSTMTMDDLRIKNRFIYVWAKAIARKGRRYQPKKLSVRAKKVLVEYLETRKDIAKPNCPFVFVTSEGTQWKPDSVSSFFKRLNARLPFTVYAHAYRGGGATFALENKVPDRLVMIQGGWKSYSVFQKYTAEASLNSYGEMLWGDDEE